MHQAIPYRTWIPTTDKATEPIAVTVDDVPGTSSASTSLQKMVSENAVIVLGRRGCCMCHVLKLLLLGHGANPAIFAVNEEDENDVVEELAKVAVPGDGKSGELQFPVVFIGGKMFGGLERVMAAHISGELVPALKDAGALWL